MVSPVTTRDDVEPDPGVWSGRSGPLADLPIRELVGELAVAEQALRERPGAPEPAARLRLLVLELRRRRARMRRLHLRTTTDGSRATRQDGGSSPPVRRATWTGRALS
jgi:hypothetical protein